VPGLDVERNVKIHHVKRLSGASFLLGRDLRLLRHPGVSVRAEEMLGKVGCSEVGTHDALTLPKLPGVRGQGAGTEHRHGTSAPRGHRAGVARPPPAAGGSLRHRGKWVTYLHVCATQRHPCVHV